MTDPDDQAEKLKEAKIEYSNAIKVSTKDTDKALLSLTYVALARIFEFFNDNRTAIQLYDLGIQIGEVTGGAFNDAVAGKQNLLQKP